MAFVTAGDFRKGITFQDGNNIFIIVDFQHVKPGKGAAFVRTKIKNIITGAVLERTFNPVDKFELAHIERKEMQYLYNDGELYYFMDQDTYEQIPIMKDLLGDTLNFIKENMTANIAFFNGSPISVEAPNFVELEITFCEPGVKGDTATGGSKPATLETGAEIKVPLFVNIGTRIRIDTRTGEYMGRA